MDIDKILQNESRGLISKICHNEEHYQNRHEKSCNLCRFSHVCVKFTFKLSWNLATNMPAAFLRFLFFNSKVHETTPSPRFNVYIHSRQKVQPKSRTFKLKIVKIFSTGEPKILGFTLQQPGRIWRRSSPVSHPKFIWKLNKINLQL